jgi:hypothetical protein
MKCKECPANYDYQIADTGDYDYGCMLNQNWEGNDEEDGCDLKEYDIIKKMKVQDDYWLVD